MTDAMPLADMPTKPPRRFRRLRIGVSAFFGVITIALCVFWVRSYWWREEVWFLRSNDVVTTFGSDHGTLFVSHGQTEPLRSLSLQVSRRDTWELGRREASLRYLGFRRWSYPNYFIIHMPHWFAALSFAAIAVVAAGSTRYSFSLRTLMLATTAAAVVLGVICYTFR